ncbi:hypothetical protein [Saliterribacillus persicus]|uniref:Uncharacterized protein n=1 Tax=Saliterribacillus persicus TaxID=930114 RepID=A0A368YGA3_9BACI|nr:hypothetical protein [Saliterribacillus persicus]RCW77214.1 hypothetical protein DFR57_10182 [Saliterribacillus persicus]
MTIKYTNFRGEDYFLHHRLTKKGNDNYYFKKNDDQSKVDEIPEGFEIYEHPNGRVFLRKKLPRLFTEKEVKIVDQGIKKYSPIKDFKLDVKKDTIYIYTYENPVTSIDEMPVIVEALSDPRYKNYFTELRFRLVTDDSDEREFIVERVYYSGSAEDEWIFLDTSTDLKDLVKTYVQHLGKDSFFDLHYIK